MFLRMTRPELTDVNLITGDSCNYNSIRCNSNFCLIYRKWRRRIHRGWRELRNGELLEQAVDEGFTTLLTRDKLFENSAKTAFVKHPEFAIVFITLPQAKYEPYIR